MTAHLLNRVTAWLLISIWIALLAWELALVLFFRERIPGTRTISMEAARLSARGFSTIAFFWSAMMAHWFLWRRPIGGDRVEAVCALTFWVLGALFLASDIFDPRRALLPAWVQWMRQTPIAALLGAVSAWLLFPQKPPGQVVP